MTTTVLNQLVYTCEPPTSSWRTGYSPLLYHQLDYLQIQKRRPDRSYWVVDEGQKTILGNVHFCFEQDRAVSHLCAPFGSYNGAELSMDQYNHFIAYLESDLKEYGINEVIYQHHAPFYQSDSIWLRVLKDRSYQIASVTNHHIPIASTPFKDRIHSMQQRKLEKCQELTLKWHSREDFTMLYQFIMKCREERQQYLSMSLEALDNVVHAVPRNFLFPAVYEGQQIIAAAVVLKVSTTVWYYFYPAHLSAYNRLSPMVFLLAGLYKAAKQQGVAFIDLGTSEVNGNLLHSLAQFKSRVGGVISDKPTCSKRL